jgi:hypothetical protein
VPVNPTTGTAICQRTFTTSGSPAIGASYLGDANFEPSTAPGLTQTVNLAATTTALTSSADPSSIGQKVVYSATVSPDPGGGTIEFSGVSGCASVRVNLATGVADCATTYTSSGTDPIGASYSGNSRFAPSSATGIVQTVSG